MTKPINKEILSNALLTLGKVLNNPQEKHVDGVINMLKSAMTEKKEVRLVRADTLADEASSVFVPTGVDWLDAWIRGGIRRGELVLIGACPHAGKTHTLTWFGIQYLLEGHKVLAVIGEDLLEDIKTYYTEGLKQHGAEDALENLWLADMQDVRFGVPEIEQTLEKLKEEGNLPDIVIIDHVDLMKGVGNKNDWEQVTDVMVELKMLAKRLNIILLTASQANFGKELKGMERFYRAKVGKAANADLIFMIDEVINDEYFISLAKARGRSRISAEERQKVLQVDWSTMSINDISN